MTVARRREDGQIAPVRAYHDYRPWVVTALIAGYIAAWVIAGVSDSLAGISVGIFMLEVVATLILDGSGVLNLRGRLWQQRLPVVATALILFFFWVFLFVWLVPYLIVAARDTWRAGTRRELSRRERIAQLEGELGFTPPSEGTCPKCHRELQAGAEFCAYCGARVQAPLQVCPVCQTTTFSDARWCPSCGAELPGTS